MTSIDHFNLRSFDLNLLVAFDALVEAGSVTAAARRLKIGQPAMSHALSTLRLLLDDDLFVRVGQAMQPTARALAVAGPVRAALAQAQAALATRDSFNPETEHRVFRLGMTSELELLLLPALTARLSTRAPGIRLHARMAPTHQVEAMIDTGVIDLAVGCALEPASRHRGAVLFPGAVSCCFNPALLPLPVPVSSADYLAARHAVVSQSDDLRGCVHEALERIDADLDVVTAAPDFLTVLATAAEAPVIATISSRVARKYAPGLGLVVSPVPLDLHFPPVRMVWPLRLDSDPATLWLRGLIQDMLA
ncbi:LysR substrate-binding domain-containing protein [Tistrella sp. BH-R2-4]|uniref:LysR substrate-binding domain-containing protein n=1 Tax=Tistrella arctica TaxID=3133430 RepID=A0ABU9YN43_9PROT